MNDKVLEPVEQRTVIFYEDEITAVVVQEEGTREVYVPLRPICDYLGIDWSGQRQRIYRDAVLSEVVQGVVVTPTPSEGGRGGGPQEMTCLPLDYLNGWLFGINANRVKAELRDRLIRYQRECYRALANAFLRPMGDTDVSPSTAALIQIREMGVAITRMADELIALDQRTGQLETRVDKAAEYVGQINRRLSTVERYLRTGKLTEEQAAEIKKRVNLIAQEMAKHDPSKSHYQAVYSALGDEAGVTSYKNIPPSAFEAASRFLDDWYQTLREAETKEDSD